MSPKPWCDVRLTATKGGKKPCLARGLILCNPRLLKASGRRQRDQIVVRIKHGSGGTSVYFGQATILLKADER
jgi:hypothetical protein